MNFTHDPTRPESSLQAQQALGSMAAQSHTSPKVAKRKQSDVEASDGWQAQNSQRRRVIKLDQFDAPYRTGTAQVDESRSGDVCDLQNCQESAAGSLQASDGDARYLQVSPVIRPQAQLVQGESQEGIVNSGLGGHLDSQIVPIEKTRSRMMLAESERKARRTSSQEDETRPPNQAEGIQVRLKRLTWQDLETDGLPLFGEHGKLFSVDSFVKALEQKSVSHSRIHHPRIQYLHRVSSFNVRFISEQVHKSFLQREKLDKFANLNWQIQDYGDLHEIIENYDEKRLTSRWHSEVIDLSDDALARIFPLPRSTKEPSLKVASFRSEFFPDEAMRKNGFLLSQCIDPLIIEILKFLWETVHVKTVAPEIPYYMVSLFQETSEEKNWFGHFLQGFRKGLKKALTSKCVQLGSHLRLVLADQAPLVTNVCATREESPERKTTFRIRDDSEIEVLEKERQTLQAEGQASEAKHFTQVNEGVTESTLLILPCASRGDPSSSMNDLATQNNLLDSRELLERDLKIAHGQNQTLEKEKSTLLAEKEQLVATHQKEKEDLLHEFRQKENQLKETYEAQLSLNKAEMSSAIDRQVKSVEAQLKNIQEQKKKDVETFQVLLEEYKKVDDKVNRLEAQRVENLTERDVKMEDSEKEMGRKLKSSINNSHIEEEQNLKKFVAEAVPILFKCLSSFDKPVLQEDAAKVLRNATSGDDYFRFQASKEAGAIAILLKCMAAKKKPNLQTCAMTVLANLASEKSMKSRIAEEEMVKPILLQCFLEEDDPVPEAAIVALRELTFDNHDFVIQFSKDAGAIRTILMSMFKPEDPILQKHAAMVLANLIDDDSSIPENQIANEAGAIDILLKCLSADDKPGLQEAAASVFASWSFESTLASQIAQSEEVISMLLRCLSADYKPHVQEEVAEALARLTHDYHYSDVLSQISKDVGAIANFLKCLAANDNPNLQRHVAALLANLSDEDPSILGNQITHEAGAIDVVLKGLSGDCVLQLQSARLLANLTCEDSIKSQFPKEEGIRILLKCLSANERPYVQEEVAKVLRNLTRGDNFAEYHLFKEGGGVAILLKCMSERYKQMPDLQKYAATVLAALARGDSSVGSQIANEAGAIDILLKCLSVDDKPGLQEAAASVLASLARKYAFRSEIANYEAAIPMLLRCLSADDKPSVQGEVAKVLANLTCEDSIKSQFSKEEGMRILLKCLSANERPYVQKNVAKVLRNLTCEYDFDDYIDVCGTFKEGGGVAILLGCMSEKYETMPDLQEDAATLLAAFARVEYSVATQIANEPRAVDILLKCLSADDKPGLQEEAASVFASLSFESTLASQIAQSEEVISMLLRCLSADYKPHVQEEVAKALGVLTRDDGFVQSQISKHVGAIAMFLKLLAANDNPNLQAHLAKVFANLAAKDSSVLCNQIANEAGAIDVVRKGLCGDCVLQFKALGLLANLTCEDSIKSQFPIGVEVPIGLKCLSANERPYVQRNVAKVLEILTGKDDIAGSDVYFGCATIILKCMSERYKRMPDLQEDAAVVSAAFARGDSSVGKQIANEAEAIDIHLKCLSADDKPGLQKEAASVLASSADESRLRLQIGNTEEAIAMLLRHLSADYKPSVQEEAAGFLANLTCEDSIKSRVPKEEGIRILLKCLSANERPYVQKNVAKVLRNLTCENDFVERSHIFKEADGAAILLKCMSERYKKMPDFQEDAASVLAAFARGDSSVGNQIAIAKGAMDILLDCLSADDKPGLQEAAARVLASSARKYAFRSEIADYEEALPMLLRYLSADDKPSVQGEVAKVLANLTSASVQGEVAKVLANLTSEDSIKSQFSKEEGMRILLKCLSANERPYVQKHVAKVLRNLTCECDLDEYIDLCVTFKEAGGEAIGLECMSEKYKKMPDLQKDAGMVSTAFSRRDWVFLGEI